MTKYITKSSIPIIGLIVPFPMLTPKATTTKVVMLAYTSLHQLNVGLL